MKNTAIGLEERKPAPDMEVVEECYKCERARIAWHAIHTLERLSEIPVGTMLPVWRGSKEDPQTLRRRGEVPVLIPEVGSDGKIVAGSKRKEVSDGGDLLWMRDKAKELAKQESSAAESRELAEQSLRLSAQDYSVGDMQGRTHSIKRG